MDRLNEFLIRGVAGLFALAFFASPFYLIMQLPNPAQPTGLELFGSFALGVLVRVGLIAGAQHYAFSSAAQVIRGESLRDACIGMAASIAMMCAVWWLH